jgi:ABC-type multidrug transport system fused ATPase/permease subunit
MQTWQPVVKAIWGFLGEQRKRYVLTMIGLTSVYFAGLLPQQLVGFGVNAISAGDISMFIAYAGGAAFIVAAVALCRLFLKQKMAEIQEETIYGVRTKGYERLMAFSLAWHDQELSGNKMQRIVNGCNSLRSLLNLTSYTFLQGVITIAGSISFLLFMYAPLGLLMSVYIMVFMFIQRSFYRRMIHMQEEINASSESAGGTYVDAITNVLAVKATGSQSHIINTVIEKEERAKRNVIAMRWLSTHKWMSFQVMTAGILLVYFIVIAYGFLNGKVNIGQILIFYSYFNISRNSLSDIAGLIDELVSSKVGIERMLPIFNNSPLHSAGTVAFPKKWSTISLKDATFSYGQDHHRNSLDGLSLQIKRGEKIGVVGISGSGKSTLAKILLGLYPLNNGSFTIDTQPVSSIKAQQWLDHIGIVLQESELFALSFKENITLLRPFDAKRFAYAVEQSGCSRILAKLPQGIHTQLGEKGYHLSGGERQRIGIARALYKHPEVLIMDEATSALDPRTEKIIQQHIMTDSDMTLVIIAHRYHTLETVDRIIVIEGGKIVEEGAFSTLLNDPSSHFSRLNRVAKKRV